jgi:ankyrin repeat protein
LSDRERLSPALGAGDVEQVRALVADGADLRYRNAEGYDALVDAVHGRDVKADAGLVPLLEYLVGQGVALDGVTKYSESGLRVLSRIGRFDAVAFLLRAGAPREHLCWTPLMEAVAVGTLDEVERLSLESRHLEAIDWWNRTAWLLAVVAGDVAKAELLRRRGANTEACGRCAAPPIMLAVQSRNPAMVRWMVEQGKDVNQPDEFGSTALDVAAEEGDPESLRILLDFGASVEGGRSSGDALRYASSAGRIRLLLDAGADIQHLSHEGRRMLLGLPPQPDAALITATRAEFERARTRRFGRTHPEEAREPYWVQMIRAGVSAYEAETRMGDRPRYDKKHPGWCAQRFGQSITFLPDGRIVQVAGEHEDSYDPDFCIYNDVFVHERGGAIAIYLYPEADFPPTDFHTATLVGDAIYLIGSLGYQGTRRFGETPVFRLDTKSWRITRFEAAGVAPGWIYKHRAKATSPTEIRVEGGKVATLAGGKEQHEDNVAAFVLDLERRSWRREGTS